MSYRQRRGWFRSVNGLPVIKRPVRNGGGGWAAGRPHGYVFHYTVGCGSDISATLNARGISVHFGVDREGVIYQYWSANRQAYHADNANGHYYGVEHSAFPGTCELTDRQLEASAKLTAALVEYTKRRRGITIPLRKIDGPDLVAGFHDHRDGKAPLWNLNGHTDHLYRWTWARYFRSVEPPLWTVTFSGTSRRFAELSEALRLIRDKLRKGVRITARKG